MRIGDLTSATKVFNGAKKGILCDAVGSQGFAGKAVFRGNAPEEMFGGDVFVFKPVGFFKRIVKSPLESACDRSAVGYSPLDFGSAANFVFYFSGDTGDVCAQFFEKGTRNATLLFEQ